MKGRKVQGQEEEEEEEERSKSKKAKRKTKQTLRSPGERAGIETKSTLLDVTTTDADVVDTGGSDSGHGSGTSELELTLHAEGLAATSGGTALVKLSTSDTCAERPLGWTWAR